VLRASVFLSAVAAICALSTPTFAETTGPAGSGAPIQNMQPSLVMTRFVANNGIFPSRDCPECAAVNTLGMVHTFAGGFGPFGSPQAQGQLLSIAQNTALFALYGTTYGGNGQTTFALPDQTGRVAVGEGQGPGLSPYDLGQTGGAAQNVMSLAQLPTHDHDLPGGGVTGPAGLGQPLNNLQPYETTNYQIAVNGVFPGGGAGDAFIGQVSMFGGNFATNGYLPADGRLLSIAEYDTLFQLIGTTYGGDGQQTFALPDLRGRTVVGTGNGLTLGQTFGQEQTFLSEANLPGHDHTLPGGGSTDPTGLGVAFDNTQPSIALNYLISLTGIFPSREGGGGLPSEFGSQFFGEVIMSATDQTPNGWARADGQLLSIAQNQALFALLGCTYGGNCQTTFALPDLRGRTILGAGAGFNVGDLLGESTHVLSLAEMAPHTHELSDTAVPEPATWTLLIGGFGLAGAALRRRRVA
jgi:microcystin-dependent protein